VRSAEARRAQLEATIEGKAEGTRLVQRLPTPAKTRARSQERLAKRGVAKPKRGLRMFRGLPSVARSRQLTRSAKSTK
jgi:hypothetical protein